MANAFGPTIQEATQAAELRNRTRLMEMAQLDLGGLSALSGLTAGQSLGQGIAGALGEDIRSPEEIEAERNNQLRIEFETALQRNRAQGLSEADAMENALNQTKMPFDIDQNIRGLIRETRESQAKISKDLRAARQPIEGPMGALLDPVTFEPVNAEQAKLARDTFRRKEAREELRARQQSGKGANEIITVKTLKNLWHPTQKDLSSFLGKPMHEASQAGVYIGDPKQFEKWDGTLAAADEVKFLWDQLVEIKDTIPDKPVKSPDASEYYRLLDQATGFEWDAAAQTIGDAAGSVSDAAMANLRRLGAKLGFDLDFDLEQARLFNARKWTAAVDLARSKQSGVLSNQDIMTFVNVFGTYGIDTKKGFTKKFKRIWEQDLGGRNLPESLRMDLYGKGRPDWDAMTPTPAKQATPNQRPENAAKAAIEAMRGAGIDVPKTSGETYETTVKMILGVPVIQARPLTGR